MGKPISPDEITGSKTGSFPAEVFDSFNQLMAESFSHNSAVVKQDAVVHLMIKKGLDRKDIFERGWLNIEEAYEGNGWNVEYDKPGYNETYDATFTFTRKSK